MDESINLELAAPEQSFPLYPAQLVSPPLIGQSSFIYFTFCAKGSCSQIDFISTLKCQEIGYTIFVLPLNHNLRCYLVSHVSGNFRLEDKHRDDFSIVDDRAVTQGGHGTWDRLLRRRTRRPSHRNLESKLPIKASFLLPNISCCHLF